MPVDPKIGAVAAIAAARNRPRGHLRRPHRQRPLLFTFSPKGVESFYAPAEEKASKGVADYLMLRRKLPDEIFDGRRVLPFSLAAMTSAMTRLLGHYRMTPRWTSHPLPVPEQIGGVGRAAGHSPVDYVQRSDA